MTQIEANGITIDYEITGEGEALLMIMGLGSQRISWPPGLIDLLLARGYQLIRFDNRDAGHSTELTGDGSYELADMADDTAAFLDGLGYDSVHVLGVSMGGMIAQCLAIQHPAKVRTLTSIMSNTGEPGVGGIAPELLPRLGELTATSLDDAVEKSMAMWEAISGSSFDYAESLARSERDTARSFRPEGQARQTAAIMAAPDRTLALQQLTIPTLVIHGDEDPLVLPSGGEATAAAIPGAKLVTYPDMGHNLRRARWADIANELDALAGR